ncbi:hypothetical protein TNCV_119491 [Trichonephila clavipes]|nr:hypothetical protein TNCV_119491 [Trichonephila clavipes]
MCLNEEIVQTVSHTRVAFECCYLVKRCCDTSFKNQNCVPHVSDFDKGQIKPYRNCGLSYHSTAARVGRDPMTVSKAMKPMGSGREYGTPC